MDCRIQFGNDGFTFQAALIYNCVASVSKLRLLHNPLMSHPRRRVPSAKQRFAYCALYSELNLNQYCVDSPGRTSCTVCGSPPCLDSNLIHYNSLYKAPRLPETPESIPKTLILNPQQQLTELVRLLQTLFEDAVQMKASDIHIELDEGVVRIRQRIDGVLNEQVMNEHRVASALVMRLKIMSGLDISEKRLPQDGRFNIRVRNRSIDVRVSTMPVQHGESVVMRLLDQSGGLFNLDHTGMPADMLARFRRLLQRPFGMVLVTGPTGSGKTTTLYAGLAELNSPEKKIITVEDPVEYRLPRVNQVQVNPKIELTFGRVLRAALRQDPDIVLVGEMRDQETAEIGLRAALTGHLVLSTLHTNDAQTSAMRLVDMGAEPFLVATALNAVLAQRLVRRVCENCMQEQQADPQQLAWLERLHGGSLAGKVFRHGAGCHQCHNTGYNGRVGVYELLEMDEPMIAALRRNDPQAFAEAARANPHYRPLAACALDYALAGVTSIDEVLKVCATLTDVDSL